MIGTVNQIAGSLKSRHKWKQNLIACGKCLSLTKQSPNDGTDLQAIIRILEDKRAEVMGNEQAGYFHPGLAGVAGSGPPVNYWRSQVQGDQG
jgi:hypothetical protein